MQDIQRKISTLLTRTFFEQIGKIHETNTTSIALN